MEVYAYHHGYVPMTFDRCEAVSDADLAKVPLDLLLHGAADLDHQAAGVDADSAYLRGALTERNRLLHYLDTTMGEEEEALRLELDHEHTLDRRNLEYGERLSRRITHQQSRLSAMITTKRAGDTHE